MNGHSGWKRENMWKNSCSYGSIYSRNETGREKGGGGGGEVTPLIECKKRILQKYYKIRKGKLYACNAKPDIISKLSQIKFFHFSTTFHVVNKKHGWVWTDIWKIIEKEPARRKHGARNQYLASLVLASRVSRCHLDTQTFINHPENTPKLTR